VDLDEVHADGKNVCRLFCGREFISVGVGPILKLIEASL